jgi:V8-like Glu-specific endopeptidase
MQQLVKPHSVLRYDVATGAVYNAKANGLQVDLSQLPGGVSYAAEQPQSQQQQGLSPSPVPGGINGTVGDAGNSTNGNGGDNDDDPLILNPEIVIDLPLKRNSSSPSPSPAVGDGSSNSSSSSPSPAEPGVGANNSSSSSPSPAAAPADGGNEAPASPSPSPVASTAPADASPSPSPSVSFDANADAAPSTVSPDGLGSNAGGRRLLFVRKGNDERSVVSSAPGFPLSAVGQLAPQGQEWHCSAALIAERTILTAAHCVYDPLSGTWAKSLSFVPRFRNAAGSVRAPVGAAAVAEVFIVGGFAVSEPQYLWEKDMAVVKLAAGTKMGSRLGHLGIFLPTAAAQQQRAQDLESAAGNEAGSNGGSRKLKLQQASSAAAGSSDAKSSWHGMLSTAGYPADRQQGTLVTTKCLSQILPGTTPRAATLKLQRCSTALGQSGGPLIDAAGNVGGVVSFEVLGPAGYNGGCAMTPWLWANLVMPNLV